MRQSILLLTSIIILGAGCAKPAAPTQTGSPSPTATTETKAEMQLQGSFETDDGLEQAKIELDLVE